MTTPQAIKTGRGCLYYIHILLKNSVSAIISGRFNDKWGPSTLFPVNDSLMIVTISEWFIVNCYHKFTLQKSSTAFSAISKFETALTTFKLTTAILSHRHMTLTHWTSAYVKHVTAVRVTVAAAEWFTGNGLRSSWDLFCSVNLSLTVYLLWIHTPPTHRQHYMLLLHQWSLTRFNRFNGGKRAFADLY